MLTACFGAIGWNLIVCQQYHPVHLRGHLQCGGGGDNESGRRVPDGGGWATHEPAHLPQQLLLDDARGVRSLLRHPSSGERSP